MSKAAFWTKAQSLVLFILNESKWKNKLNNAHFPQVRRHVYHDADNLDTAFDAGGKVSIGLTATTIVSQWTWSATLLQSSTVASKVMTITCMLSNMAFP